MRRIKDYHRKQYNNPFFKKTKKGLFSRSRNRYYNRRGSWRAILALFLSTFLIGISVYFVFFSQYFAIKNILISGTEKISQDEMRGLLDTQISARRFFVFSQNNIFIFDEKTAEKTISEKYALNFFKINKRLPGTLQISLEEKKPAIIWKTTDKFYLIDWGGAIISEISSEEVPGYPGNQPGAKMAVVFDDSNASVAVKDEILNSQIIQNINYLQNNLPQTTGLQISNMAMASHDDPTIRCATDEGWEAYFSLASDLSTQINKLKIFLEQKNKDERRGLQYIDLRFEDRVYYK
jgi:cell division septal protein FtsQ